MTFPHILIQKTGKQKKSWLQGDWETGWNQLQHWVQGGTEEIDRRCSSETTDHTKVGRREGACGVSVSERNESHYGYGKMMKCMDLGWSGDMNCIIAIEAIFQMNFQDP